MRVVVAGASGAIGRRLVPQLLAAGHEVVAIARRPVYANSPARYGDGVTEITADVLNRAAFLEAIDGLKADAVVNQLTALRRAPLTHRDMRTTNRLRSEGTSTLIAAARRLGATRFVAASFFAGYGYCDHGTTEIGESARFGDPDGHNDAVQAALLSSEQQVRAFGGQNLRYGLIYDPDNSRATPVPALWSGVLPVLHVADAASAVLSALANGAQGEAYNIADDDPATFRRLETARAIAAGRRPPLVVPDAVLRTVAPYGSQLITRTSARLSTSKARNRLDWHASYPSIRDGLPAPRVERVTGPGSTEFTAG
jgi:nucleoside-diphosphate-sugar epimerase